MISVQTQRLHSVLSAVPPCPMVLIPLPFLLALPSQICISEAPEERGQRGQPAACTLSRTRKELQAEVVLSILLRMGKLLRLFFLLGSFT